VLQNLVNLAKDIRAEQARGEAEVLTPDEVAYYDALADNESVIGKMGNDNLKVVFTRLVNSLRANAAVDWSHGEIALAQMRIVVRRILRKHRRPPRPAAICRAKRTKRAELLVKSG